MKPTKPISKDPNWKYVTAERTNVAATIRRIKREQAEKAQGDAAKVRKLGTK